MLDEFTALSAYKDCAEIASRFVIYRDRLTTLVETNYDLIGNTSHIEWQYVKYDPLGRVIWTEDETIMRSFCVAQPSKQHAEISITYVDDTVDSKIEKYTYAPSGVISKIERSIGVTQAETFSNPNLKWSTSEITLDENGFRPNFTYGADGRVLSETYVNHNETRINEYIYEDLYFYRSPAA